MASSSKFRPSCASRELHARTDLERAACTPDASEKRPRWLLPFRQFTQSAPKGMRYEICGFMGFKTVWSEESCRPTTSTWYTCPSSGPSPYPPHLRPHPHSHLHHPLPLPSRHPLQAEQSLVWRVQLKATLIDDRKLPSTVLVWSWANASRTAAMYPSINNCPLS